jgi:hypothetical protein
MTTFGIMTAPQQVDYRDLLRVWRDADAIDVIDHAWLFEHPCRSAATRSGLPMSGSSGSVWGIDPAAGFRAIRDDIARRTASLAAELDGITTSSPPPRGQQ